MHLVACLNLIGRGPLPHLARRGALTLISCTIRHLSNVRKLLLLRVIGLRLGEPTRLLRISKRSVTVMRLAARLSRALLLSPANKSAMSHFGCLLPTLGVLAQILRSVALLHRS